MVAAPLKVPLAPADKELELFFQISVCVAFFIKVPMEYPVQESAAPVPTQLLIQI